MYDGRVYRLCRYDVRKVAIGAANTRLFLFWWCETAKPWFCNTFTKKAGRICVSR